MSIKTVAFDYGGVICFPPLPHVADDLEKLTGIPSSQLDELNRKYRGEFDRGTYDGAGYFRFILSSAGVFHDDETLKKIVQADMDGWKRLNPVSVQLMRDIKAAGFTLAILSNMPVDFLIWAREHIPIFAEADIAIFSCEHDLIKPEAEIYEKLREETQSDYGEIVFFDDLADNIAKARELGIQGFMWNGPEAARETLKQLDKGFDVL